jgi:hypothetical protein
MIGDAVGQAVLVLQRTSDKDIDPVSGGCNMTNDFGKRLGMDASVCRCLTKGSRKKLTWKPPKSTSTSLWGKAISITILLRIPQRKFGKGSVSSG